MPPPEKPPRLALPPATIPESFSRRWRSSSGPTPAAWWDSAPESTRAPAHHPGRCGGAGPQADDGSVIPTRLVDVGDARARFFVAVWSGAPCTAVVARDPGGGELETKAFRPFPGQLRST